MLTLYGRRSAFNVQKVLWGLGEVGAEFEHVPLGGDHGGLDQPSYRALNPHGRVPTLVDGDTAVWESHAILRYLAARTGAGTLWAEDPAERAKAEQWMDWAQTSLQPDFMAVFWQAVRTPEGERDPARLARAVEDLTAHYHLLDGILADQPYLAGDSFTLADIPAGATLYRYFEMTEIARPDMPHLARWYARLCERPAYREHVMRPFDELRGKLAY